MLKRWAHNGYVRDFRWLRHVGVGAALAGTQINCVIQNHIDYESAMYSLQFRSASTSFLPVAAESSRANCRLVC